MKIVGIMGSPRKNGNTAKLLSWVMKGAEKEGAEFVLYYPNELNIRGCQGCNACKGKGYCIIDDDMQRIYQAINQADIVIFSSPVYMWGMSAQLKLVVDRLYFYMNADYSSRLSRSIKFALLFTQHRVTDNAFMQYFESVGGILQAIGFKFVPDILVGSGLQDVNDIKQNNVLRDKAHALGRKLVTTP